MVNFEWRDRAISVPCPDGERVLDALDEYPHPGTLFACRDGRCGHCRATIVQGAAHLAPIEVNEAETLGAAASARGERLVCQLRVCSDAGHVIADSSRRQP